MPCSLQLEPMRLATGNAVELAAGSSIPETGVAVLGGGAQRMTRGLVGGEKAAFAVVQRLWRVEANSPSAAGKAQLLCSFCAALLSSVMQTTLPKFEAWIGECAA